MVSLERIRVSPIASLGGVAIPEAELARDGLAWDRRYAIVERPPEAGSDGESAGRPVDGVRERRLHALAADYDLGRETVTVGPSGTDERHAFHLELDRAGLATWLSEYVGYPVEVARDDEPWFPADADGPDRTGPTVVSTGTLEAVAS